MANLTSYVRSDQRYSTCDTVLIGCLVVSCIIFLAGAVAAKEQHTVVVTKEKPRIVQRVFDLRDHSGKRPRLSRGEKALTEGRFRLTVNFKIEVLKEEESQSGWTVTIKPESTRIKLMLPITIWIPYGAPRKLIRHEHGHRLIFERIYEDADQLMRYHAESMRSSIYRGEGRTREEAIKVAYQRAAEDLNMIYRRAVLDYSNCVSDEYDRLTHHGLNNMREELAIEESFKACVGYREEFESIKKLSKRNARGGKTESPKTGK